MLERILVTGAGGFIGHHLVARLRADGFWVRGVDIKYPEYETSAADEFEILDLRRFDNCLVATRNVHQVYNLAADMGGIGYITAFLARISCNNTLINAHMLEASRLNEIGRASCRERVENSEGAGLVKKKRNSKERTTNRDTQSSEQQ